MPVRRYDGIAKAPAGAFFLLCVLLLDISAAHACTVDHVDDVVQVRQVFDGDTILLVDGRKVRMLGINTPEIDHENGDDEPLARKARQSLQRILDGAARVGLRYGKRRHDHYGRVLAYVIIDGQRDVQQMLLEQGLAMAIAISPDLWNQDCYQDAENQARHQQIGIWGQDYYRPLDVDHGRPQRGGFRLLHGSIRHVGTSADFVWFDLDYGVSLRLAKVNRGYFSDRNWNDWLGRRVEARGWLYEIRHRQGSASWQMNIYHPQNLHPIEVSG